MEQDDLVRAKREEVDRNYEEFRKILPNIEREHQNEYALMRHGEIVTYYTTLHDATVTGEKFYPDGIYSIQKVTSTPVDLGYFSHALDIR